MNTLAENITGRQYLPYLTVRHVGAAESLGGGQVGLYGVAASPFG